VPIKCPRKYFIAELVVWSEITVCIKLELGKQLKRALYNINIFNPNMFLFYISLSVPFLTPLYI